MEKRENDIIIDACYLIDLYHKKNKTITQLHVQKLMFLFEAYYMNMVDNVSQLYECEYQAWDFGPVATQLYKHFKKFGKDDIILSEEEVKLGNDISEQKKEYFAHLYKAFGDFTATQLVNFTHANGSPWKNAWEREPYSKISKREMKVWFSQYVVKN